MSNISQDVIALNDYTQERRRTTSAGTKSRYTITIDAQPILHNLSESNLGEGPARAIQDAIQRQIRNIMDVAKPSTIIRRQSAARMLASGVSEDNKAARRSAFGKKEIAAGRGHLLGDGHATIARYSGGRTGTKPPSGSVRLFNDSGRLADGILVRQNREEKNWTINVTANRLDPSTFRSRADFLRMVERLYERVPILRNPMTDPAIERAVNLGIEDRMLRVVEDDKRLQGELMKMRLELVKRI